MGYDLFLGYSPGGTGFYDLSEGRLGSGDQNVGYSGMGGFTQSGGTNSLGYNLVLGAQRGGEWNL